MSTVQTRACHRLAEGTACRHGLDGNKASRPSSVATNHCPQQSRRHRWAVAWSAFRLPPPPQSGHAAGSFPFLLAAHPTCTLLAANHDHHHLQFRSRLGTTTHKQDISTTRHRTHPPRAAFVAACLCSIRLAPSPRPQPTRQTTPALSYHTIFAA